MLSSLISIEIFSQLRRLLFYQPFYILIRQGANEDDFEITADGSKWMVDNTYISDLCFDFKNAILKLSKPVNPAQLSDIRILILSDIYKFDRNFASSISKYFLKSRLSFDAYLPTNRLDCYGWYREIEISPPVDWSYPLTLCAELLAKACASKNRLDMHTAHVFTQILPVLINGRPDDSSKDSYVHYCLSPLLTSVFGPEPLLRMKWANGQLIKSNYGGFKPDFLVYNLSGSVKNALF